MSTDSVFPKISEIESDVVKAMRTGSSDDAGDGLRRGHELCTRSMDCEDCWQVTDHFVKKVAHCPGYPLNSQYNFSGSELAVALFVRNKVKAGGEVCDSGAGADGGTKHSLDVVEPLNNASEIDIGQRPWDHTAASEVVPLTSSTAGDVMDCTYIRRLVFEQRSLLRDMPLWRQTQVEKADQKLESDINAGQISPLVAIGRCAKDDAGLGLFAIASIPKGTYIGEYAGALHHAYEFDSFGLDYPSNGSTAPIKVSASIYGNAIRCVNHGTTSSAVNSVFRRVSVAGLVRVACVSLRDIRFGEQVLTDYGVSYWGAAGVGVTPTEL